jgi:propane monooxygenase reductase subunit
VADKTHTVRFEPVGIEIEVDESETILNAAFRQGIMLMHGCKEGQCSACKSFILDGEVDLDRYSTFALPDFEEAEGWTLCAAPTPTPTWRSSLSTTTRRSSTAARRHGRSPRRSRRSRR